MISSRLSTAFVVLTLGAFHSLLAPNLARADDALPGHSAHGEAFNEGPRQAAVLIPGTGKVVFKISTDKPDAQKFFTQGVGQLHGFWYYEAERSFRQVAMLDPKCAMAYWGMAMANVNNDKRAKEFIKKAAPLKAKATDREKQWITTLETFYKDNDKRDKKQRSLDLIRDLETLVQDDPKDLEAKAFLVWKIWQSNGEAPITSSVAVDALLEQIFAANPEHPANHYRIHLWDSANKPKHALTSAARCGQSAPGIAHMWHMPGHTFSKLRRFDDAAWQQEASTRVDHAYMMRDLVLPDQIHNYAHNEEWLVRTYNELGRANDALRLAESLITIPRHPAYNHLDKSGNSASYGRTRLLDTLQKWELWDRLIQEAEGPRLGSVTQTSHEAARLRALGVAYYERGNLPSLTQTLTALEALEKTAAAAKAKAKAEEKKATPAPASKATAAQDSKKAIDPKNAKEAAKKPDATPTVATAPTTPAKAPNAAATTAAVPATPAKATAPVPVTTKTDAATATKTPAAPAKATTPATAAVAKTDTATPAKKGGKPDVDPILPALAELRALKAILTKDAAAAKLLAAATDLSKERLARLWLTLGDKKKAEEQLKNFSQELASLAAKTEVLQALGKTEDAKKAFEETRKVAFAMDADLPIAQRLAKLAVTFGVPGDWRAPAPKRTDVGVRPPLPSLGPVHWSPSPAPAWEALTLEGKPISGQTFTAGKPTILLFYLGSTCGHCMSQINAFAKAAPDYQKAGIQLAGVTLEPMSVAAGITEQMASKKLPPFPILCDPSLNAFKAFRAYDDFEQEALHAAVLIDAEGKIRWLDVNWEPFTNTKFLLDEAVRLLKMPVLDAGKVGAVKQGLKTP